MKNYYFSTKKMCVGYDNKPLIKDMEIKLREGEILCLIGPNGAGKSTVLKSIAGQLGLLGGAVYLGEDDLSEMKAEELAKRMSVVFTERVRVELKSCRDMVATGRYPYTGWFGILSEEDERIVDEVMRLTHITDISEKDFGKISDGQKQRVMLARAICQEPEIVILDEPTSYLDIKYKLEFLLLLQEMREKKAALTLMKIGPLQQALSREEELAGKHAEYEKTASRIAELEALAPDYEAKKAAVQTAQAEVDRLDREYKAAHERLTLRLDTLRKKVELLNDSGCPDVEKASCKFLADALEAKKQLPAAGAAIADLENEYAENRLKSSEALTAAQNALGDSLYHPEEIDALRGVQRGLEAAEKEYNSLEAQRNELKLLTERAEELEKAVTDAEATAEKGKAELAEVTAQLTKVAQASADYDRLQAEIAVARQWTEKEKQLPVAREKKAAAAQRVLELDTELETIEEEIAEAREELAQEQSKTVGKEVLQAQVDGAEEMIKTLQEHARSADVTLGGLKKQLEQAEKRLAEAAELQKQMNELGGKAAGYEELKKAFSQDGIPHNIIRSIIPIFEATATNILGQMSQGHMSVEFVTEKILKSNSKKEVTTLDIIINDSDTGRLPYMSRSGGERVKAALSVILALSEIKSSKAGVQLGFLFIDEPPFLDAPGVQAYCDALEAIQQRYGNLKVMAITHDPAMKSRFPQSVDVVKTAEGSKVIYE